MHRIENIVESLLTEAYRVAVKELPSVVVKALREVKYGRSDIGVTAATSASLASSGGAGERAFVILVNLDSEDYKVHWGSWGGPNMFNPNNPVDLDTSTHSIPPNGAVITGSIGGGPTYASLLVHPSNMPKFLPSVGEVTDHEKAILRAMVYKSDYKKELLQRMGATQTEIADLVKRGFIKMNAAGATQITTAGRNAIGG